MRLYFFGAPCFVGRVYEIKDAKFRGKALRLHFLAVTLLHHWRMNPRVIFRRNNLKIRDVVVFVVAVLVVNNLIPSERALGNLLFSDESVHLHGHLAFSEWTEK